MGVGARRRAEAPRAARRPLPLELTPKVAVRDPVAPLYIRAARWREAGASPGNVTQAPCECERGVCTHVRCGWSLCTTLRVGRGHGRGSLCDLRERLARGYGEVVAFAFAAVECVHVCCCVCKIDIQDNKGVTRTAHLLTVSLTASTVIKCLDFTVPRVRIALHDCDAASVPIALIRQHAATAAGCGGPQYRTARAQASCEVLQQQQQQRQRRWQWQPRQWCFIVRGNCSTHTSSADHARAGIRNAIRRIWICR